MTPEQELLYANAVLEEALGGATVLNVYLLNKLGGQLVVDKSEMATVCQEFSQIAYGVDGQGQIVIKLCSTPERKAVTYGN